VPELVGDRGDGVDDGVLILIGAADEGRAGGVGDRGVPAVLAGQEAVLERAPRDQRHALVERERREFALDGSPTSPG